MNTPYDNPARLQRLLLAKPVQRLSLSQRLDRIAAHGHAAVMWASACAAAIVCAMAMAGLLP